MHFGVAHLPCILQEAEDGLRFGKPVEVEADAWCRDAQEVREATARDVDHRVHRHALPLQRLALADVHARGLEEFLGHAPAALGELGMDVALQRLEEDAARERETVRVEPRGRDADDDIASNAGAAVAHAILRHDADTGANEIVVTAVAESLDEIAHLGDLAAGDGDLRATRALGEALAELLHDGSVHEVHADVVHHRHGIGTDAHDVVRVHRDAVDAHGVVLASHLGDEHLGADGVRRDGERERRAFGLDDAREVAMVCADLRAWIVRERAAEMPHEAGEARILAGVAHAGGCVLAHVSCVLRPVLRAGLSPRPRPGSCVRRPEAGMLLG